MLYILATPLGNLDDLSDRAKNILKDAHLIIAENPGYSKKILDYLKITGKEFTQFAEHNEGYALPKILQTLMTLEAVNQSAVLMTDAGTPGISDPGFKLVRAAIEVKIPVVPIPGPNAAITALSASGLPTDKFIFMGFVPKTEIKLLRELDQGRKLEATTIFYESPHRIIKTLGYIAKEWPFARTVVARELTKMHEEFIRGTAAEVLQELQRRPSIKGEITVLLGFKDMEEDEAEKSGAKQNIGK